ncbi:MAG: glycosyltransferase family 2 protein [Planctomycetota bacterium]
MKLTVVIPAYNEEQAIAAIIERTLAARESIIARSPVGEVEIVVVSDGSTDETAEIAADYGEVKLVVFEKNRGYGAAIKKGFEVGAGELVGFLDADGTCDPKFFADLCTAVVEESASVAIGSRLGPGSKMPRVRRLGNRVYALILSVLSNRLVSDTASGMRVIRRDVLSQLYPLPDGLHFTPAMSARVLMDDRLSLVERPMSYEERVGESKLHVLRDGARFLRTILHMSMMWRPARMFSRAAIACLLLMTLLAVFPLESRARTGRFGEDTIYRLLFCSFLGTVSVSFLSATVLCDRLHELWDARRTARSFAGALLDRAYSFGGVGVAMTLSAPLLCWLIGPGVWTRIHDGVVTIHWSRVVLAGLVAFSLVQISATAVIANLIRFHLDRQSWRMRERVVSTTQKRRSSVDAVSGQGLPSSSPTQMTSTPVLPV